MSRGQVIRNGKQSAISAQRSAQGNDDSRKASQSVSRSASQRTAITKQQESRTAKEQKRKIGLTKDNRSWICKEPLDQPKKGRLRLTCSDACRKARSRVLQGKNTHKFNREKKLVERRRSKPFIERKFSKTFFEPVLEITPWLKWYECLACGQPYEVNRMKNGNPVRPYCSDKCEVKTKRHWDKFLDAYERAHQRGELDKRVEERFWYDKLSPLCPRCGKPFAPNTTLHGKRKPGRPRKYCSDYCRKEAYEQRWKNKHKRARVHRYRDCLECGEKFDRTDLQGRRIKMFCSPRCVDTFAHRALRLRERMGVIEVKRGTTGRRWAIQRSTKNKALRLLANSNSRKATSTTTMSDIGRDVSRDSLRGVVSGGEAGVLCSESA